MWKRFLITLLLIFCFTISSASNTEIQYSKYTFSNITGILNDKVFVEIRKYVKDFKLFPFTDEKGTMLVNDVADIIIKYENNKDFLLKKKPLVALQGILVEKVPQRFMFYLQISLVIIEFDRMKYGKPILGDLVIIKHIFITFKDKTVDA